MQFVINEIDWDSFDERKDDGKLIIFCLDEVRVRVIINTYQQIDNGWKVEVTVSSIATGQSKLALQPGHTLRGMLIKEKWAPAKRNYGWLCLAA
jgi:hypothetical protein